MHTLNRSDRLSRRQRAQHSHNVGGLDRTLSVIAGAGTLLGGAHGASNGLGLGGAVLGGLGAALLQRGFTGHCYVYEKLGISTLPNDRRKAGVPENLGQKIEQKVTIHQPPETVFRYWRDLRHLPRFMKRISRVDVDYDGSSHWVASGPAGSEIEWDARIIHEKPDELISWESLPGSDLQCAGAVRFEPARGGRGTEVTVTLSFRPPLGIIGALGGPLFKKALKRQLREDLRRLQQLLEAGELTTAEIS